MERYIDPKYQKPPKTRLPHRFWAKGIEESGMSWADMKLERRVYTRLPRRGNGTMTAQVLAGLLKIPVVDVYRVVHQSPRMMYWTNVGVARTR